MEKIPYQTIIDIQKKVNIVDVISEYLPISQKGRNYFAVCPFHDDHNPSMSISPEKQIYTCFVCGASGNVFHFVMNYEKISFVEAVIKVAKKVSISLDIKNDVVFKKSNVFDKYYKMFDVVNKYYQNNINTIYGKEATKYLSDRNLSDEVIKFFEIGLSLNDNGVNKLLLSKKHENSDQIEVGICATKDNFIYDVFRSRIMFPIHNSDGQVVGFSGRIYNSSLENKYVNSKESVIFKKGNILYNYHRAKIDADEEKSIIVVEGFMDVIRLYTVGIKNVVATMGTAITKEHAQLIKRLSKNVILCFDGDKAGEKATISAVDALEKLGINPKIIRLEDNYDPDDYIVKKGLDLFKKHLKAPITSLDFKMSISKEKFDFNDYLDVSKYVSSVAGELSKITDKVVYELTLKQLSKETGVDVKTIESLVTKIPSEDLIIIDKRKYEYKNKYKKAEIYLIYQMLNNVEAVLAYQKKVSYLSNKNLATIAIKILEFYNDNNYINVTDFITYLEDDTLLINEVLKIDSLKLPKEFNIDEFNDYILTIESGLIKEEINNLRNKITSEKDQVKKIALLEKLASLKKKEWE
ncbi:MAG: DNA primase [Bacilli bacterium]